LKSIHPDIHEDERQRFNVCISTDLNATQKKWITHPESVYPRQSAVLAVHWHPEFIPIELIAERLNHLYPNRQEALVIPTQHNQILAYGTHAGVEVDCYSSGFHSKVQLLIHLRKDKLEQASVFKNILKHTFTYRSSQLFNYLRALTRPDDQILQWAARETGATPEVIRLARLQARQLEILLDENYDTVPPAFIKNKLIRDYVDLLRTDHDNDLIDHAQTFLRAVKYKVKEGFPLSYFYRTSEVIEEARALGAGIVIPHPEQFWPILLADYDVDGYEVWNPQSQEYTEFLVTVLTRRNKQLNNSRPLLVFMGDDTHFSEKVRDPETRDREKAAREIGFQPAWEDMQIQKQLLKAGMDRAWVIREYAARLKG
jgi:hypothetical protein